MILDSGLLFWATLYTVWKFFAEQKSKTTSVAKHFKNSTAENNVFIVSIII